MMKGGADLSCNEGGGEEGARAAGEYGGQESWLPLLPVHPALERCRCCLPRLHTSLLSPCCLPHLEPAIASLSWRIIRLGHACLPSAWRQMKALT